MPHRQAVTLRAGTGSLYSAGFPDSLIRRDRAAERPHHAEPGATIDVDVLLRHTTFQGARSPRARFPGAYHGIFDEVIVRGTRKLKTIPAAPGILPESSQNILVLDYGTPESLEILRQRADTLAAIVVEPIQGEGGYIVPQPEFLRGLATIARKHGILLVVDEVQSGIGRTGRMWAVDHWGVEPDILLTAKGIASGMPIGGLVARAEISTALSGSSSSRR